MAKKFNKKDLRAFAEKVKAPEIVTSLFREVESEITRIAVFDIHRIGGERLLTTALFNEQGCYAVVFTRKTGEVISIETDTGKWYKQQHYQEATYGMDLAQVNLSAVVDFFSPTDDIKPNSLWRTKVESYKWKMSAKRSVENARKRSIETNAMFANLSPLPSNFKSWCRRDLSRIVFDTSDRHHGYCQYCGQDIDVADKLVQERIYKCPHCHHSFEAISSHSHKWVREKGYSLYAEMDGRVVIRHFVLRIFKNRSVKNDWYEYERDVLDFADNGYYMYIKDIKHGYDVWRNEKKYVNSYGTGDLQLWWNDEKLYPHSDFSLLSYKQKKIVMSECKNEYRWEEALTFKSKNLEIAQILHAAGYSKELAYGTYNHYEDPEKCHKYHTPQNIVAYGRTPKDILRVDGNIAKLFKDKRYGYYELCCYAYFRSKTKEGCSPQAFSRSLMFAAKSFEHYKKYVELLAEFNLTVAQVSKYFKVTPNSRTFDLWFDYLRHFRDAAKMSDLKLHGKSWMFPPVKDIGIKHDEAVKWYGSLYQEWLKKERERKEKAIQKFVSGLASLDNYEVDGMIAKIPHTYNDFVEEGTNNSNCVGHGWYFDRMSEAKSIVVFLRTKENKSYCTCEFTFDNGEIRLRQCRLKSNKDAPDTVHKSAQKYGRLLQNQLMINQAVA